MHFKFLCVYTQRWLCSDGRHIQHTQSMLVRTRVDAKDHDEVLTTATMCERDCTGHTHARIQNKHTPRMQGQHRTTRTQTPGHACTRNHTHAHKYRCAEELHNRTAQVLSV